MKQEGIWPTQVELNALANYFQVPLHMCSPHPNDQAQLAFQQNHVPHNSTQVNHIELCHTAENYFDCFNDEHTLLHLSSLPHAATPLHLRLQTSIRNTTTYAQHYITHSHQPIPYVFAPNGNRNDINGVLCQRNFRKFASCIGVNKTDQ